MTASKIPSSGKPRRVTKGYPRISPEKRAELLAGMERKRRRLNDLVTRYFEVYVSEVLREYPEFTRRALLGKNRVTPLVDARYTLAALLYHVVVMAEHQDAVGEHCDMWPTSMHRALYAVDKAMRSIEESALKTRMLRICKRMHLPPTWFYMHK